jgi:DUF218 domain
MRRQETAPFSLQARIAVELRCPPAMEGHLAHILEGEYESGYAGVNLWVLDIGANAGAFSIWAAHRWPGITIDAYEPDPGSFQLLQANTRSYPMVRCQNVAVYPSEGKDLAFTSRYAGDGEAGLVEVISEIFGQGNNNEREFFRVPALHPRELPHADAIVLLAGVTGKAYPPQPVLHLGARADRLIYAALLYKQNKAPLVIVSGNDAESAGMTQLLEMMGIPRSAMLGENVVCKIPMVTPAI